ncbi:MAG: hypothetical protein ACUVQY_04800 [Thermoproteota archaeon]
MRKEERSKRKKLLLMGSSAFKEKELPAEVRDRIDEAMADKLKIMVGEAPGARRLYQDYLKSKGYRNVVVGHAVKRGTMRATGRSCDMEGTWRKGRGT